MKGLLVEIFPSSGTRLAAILGSWVVINTLTLACMFVGVLMGSWVRLCQGGTSRLLYHKLINILKIFLLVKMVKSKSLSSEVEVLAVCFQSVLKSLIIYSINSFACYFFKVQIKIVVPKRNFRDNTLL